MKYPIKYALAALSLFALAAQSNAENASWPNWRGPSKTGVVADAKPPIEWSETKNIKWKTKIPGSGLATPIVWEDRIFLLTAIPQGQPEAESAPAAGFDREAMMKEFDKNGDGRLSGDERAAMRKKPAKKKGKGGAMSIAPKQGQAFSLLALERKNGKILWSKTARTELPHEGHHPTNGFSSGSPITDGQHIWVSFGSRGLYCYDLNGNLKWEKDLGDMRTRAGFGEGASPALAGNLLILTWDHEDQSYIVGLNKKTGKEVWRQNRDEQTSWTTPLIVKTDGVQQAIIPGSKKTRSYNAQTGELIWEASGLTSNVIPSPVTRNGLVYVMSGYKGRSVQAIKLSSQGDVSDSDNIVWSADHSAPYVASPVLSGNRLFMNKGNDAYMACFDAKTGEVHYRDEALEGLRGVYASPIAANGHLYVLGRDGTSAVLKDSKTFEVVATNKLDEPIDASPVIIGNDLFIRSHQHLYCISEDS